MKNIFRKKTKQLKKPIGYTSNLFILAEKVHIQAHLAFTELRLRVRKSSNLQRSMILDVLNDYWVKGIFPKNTYELSKRKPVFIDSKGVYCAVGHLMVETGYAKLANDIDRDNKFVLVEDVNNKKVDAWLDVHGLTKKEAALIQPGYGGFVIERVGYSFQDKIMAALSIMASVVLIYLIVAVLRLIANKSALSRKEKKSLFIGSAAIVAIIISFVFVLPLPMSVMRSLTSSSQGPETISCPGWNRPNVKRHAICDEFEEKGSVPGWRRAPSMPWML